MGHAAAAAATAMMPAPEGLLSRMSSSRIALLLPTAAPITLKPSSPTPQLLMYRQWRERAPAMTTLATSHTPPFVSGFLLTFSSAKPGARRSEAHSLVMPSCPMPLKLTSSACSIGVHSTRTASVAAPSSPRPA